MCIHWRKCIGVRRVLCRETLRGRQELGLTVFVVSHNPMELDGIWDGEMEIGGE